MLYENDKHVKSTVSVQRVWHRLVEVIPFTVRLSQKLRSQSSTTKELQSSIKVRKNQKEIVVSSWAEIRKIFRCFFWEIKDTTISYWNFLTFSRCCRCCCSFRSCKCCGGFKSCSRSCWYASINWRLYGTYSSITIIEWTPKIKFTTWCNFKRIE